MSMASERKEIALWPLLGHGKRLQGFMQEIIDYRDGVKPAAFRLNPAKAELLNASIRGHYHRNSKHRPQGTKVAEWNAGAPSAGQCVYRGVPIEVIEPLVKEPRPCQKGLERCDA